MSEHNETLAEIVAEMRKRMKSYYYSREGRNLMRQYADRIEAAWRRERGDLLMLADTAAKILGHEREEADRRVEEVAKFVPVGNSAAMREALSTAIILLKACEWPDDTPMQDVAEVMDEIEKALSAPPRNCDRYNSGDPVKDADDAYAEWQRQCDAVGVPPSCKVESAFRQWLLAPATEKGVDDE